MQPPIGSLPSGYGYPDPVPPGRARGRKLQSSSTDTNDTLENAEVDPVPQKTQLSTRVQSVVANTPTYSEPLHVKKIFDDV